MRTADQDDSTLNCDNRDLTVIPADLLSMTSPQSFPDVSWVGMWNRRYDCYNGAAASSEEQTLSDSYLKAIRSGDLSDVVDEAVDLISSQAWCNFVVLEAFWRIIEVSSL